MAFGLSRQHDQTAERIKQSFVGLSDSHSAAGGFDIFPFFADERQIFGDLPVQIQNQCHERLFGRRLDDASDCRNVNGCDKQTVFITGETFRPQNGLFFSLQDDNRHRVIKTMPVDGGSGS